MKHIQLFENFVNERMSDKDILSKWKAKEYDSFTEEDIDRLTAIQNERSTSSFIRKFREEIPHVEFPDDEGNLYSNIGNGNPLGKKTIEILKNIPPQELKDAKTKFMKIIKSRMREGLMMYHCSPLRFAKKIRENGLTNKWNYFEWGGYSTHGPVSCIQVGIDPTGFLDRIYPDPERHWKHGWMMSSMVIIQELIKYKLDLDTIYWMYFNELKAKDSQHLSVTDFPLHWMVVKGEIRPESIKEIIIGKNRNGKFTPAKN